MSDATVQFRAVGPLSGAGDELSDATVQFRAVGPLSGAGDELSDATVQFRAVGPLSGAGDELSDATVQFRAVGPLSGAGDELSDATVQFRAVGPLSGAGDEASDATVQFRAVGPLSGAGDEASDATVQFQVIGLSADPLMPLRVISQPTYGHGHVDGDRGQAELRSLIQSILAGLGPREREVIELSFRHDLNDDDLAVVLGVSQSRAHGMASGARGGLEEALGALHIALTGREACPVLGELLADWDGQLTEQTRDLVVMHVGECQTCPHHGWGAMRPAAFFRLLPLASLPPELRAQVLNLCTSTAEDAVAYRRRVARRAERIWLARFSRALRQASWSSIRANPGWAVAAVAVAVWVAAAVSVTMLTFTGSRAADAQTPGSRSAHVRATQPRVPAAVTTTVPTSATARPSPTVTRSQVAVPTPVQTVPSRVAATSPAPSRSKSSSARPSKSPRPSRSGSPSPSHTASPSPSPSSSTSPPAT